MNPGGGPARSGMAVGFNSRSNRANMAHSRMPSHRDRRRLGAAAQHDPSNVSERGGAVTSGSWPDCGGRSRKPYKATERGLPLPRSHTLWFGRDGRDKLNGPAREIPMAEFERLSVLLPQELARAVREAVDGERYIVESDIVIDALQDWQVKQQVRAAKLQRLRELINEGIASGSEPMAPDEFEQIKRQGRARLAGRKAAE